MCPPNYGDKKNLERARNKARSAIVRQREGSKARAGKLLSNAGYRLCTLPKSLTYAALVDRHRRETEITDFMVRRACDEMDNMQQFPFAPGQG